MCLKNGAKLVQVRGNLAIIATALNRLPGCCFAIAVVAEP